MPMPHHHYEFGTFNDRLEHFCALFEIDPPEIVYEDGEPSMTEPLMDWVKETNANMDWLFAGSPCAMLRQWTRARSREREIRESDAMTNHDKVQAAMAILQQMILAEDSVTDGRALFKMWFMGSAHMELVHRLLSEVLPDLEVDYNAAMYGGGDQN